MVDRALRRSMLKARQSRKPLNIARRSARSTHESNRTTGKKAIQSMRSFFMSSKCEPDNLDFRGDLDVFVANDKI
jgi:hypothetical protein